LTLPFNIAGAIYCLLTSYLDGDTMNWLLTASCAAGAIALLFFKEKQHRRVIDDGIQPAAGHTKRHDIITSTNDVSIDRDNVTFHNPPLLNLGNPV
jgi:hypothetical protein